MQKIRTDDDDLLVDTLLRGSMLKIYDKTVLSYQHRALIMKKNYHIRGFLNNIKNCLYLIEH